MTVLQYVFRGQLVRKERACASRGERVVTDPARYPWLRLDAELTVRDRIVPTPLFWLVGGGFVLLCGGRVRGWA